MPALLSDRKLSWESLLSAQRLQPNEKPSSLTKGRTNFDRDYDRIIFSAPFRHLQDKTQVFPLSPSDDTRTRLTHSLEVASVGRSLGQIAGEFLQKESLLPENVAPADVGFIVASACLAHDLGNPPFGHSGEDAIQQWALRQINDKSLLQDFTEPQRKDFLKFEGNAQSFRILARLEGRERPGGLRLTYATLGTLLKYPRPSWVDSKIAHRHLDDVAFKKFNYFQNETNLAIEVCDATGMIQRSPGVYARHPLAFLMEAADDICYAIVDLEDAFRLKLISFKALESLLKPLCRTDTASVSDVYEDDTKIVVLRSYAINGLINQCMNVFQDNLEAIEAGKFNQSLIQASPVAQHYKQLKDTAKEQVYTNERVLLVEYAGYETIGGLLDFFYSAIVGKGESQRDGKLRQIVPSKWLRFEGTHQARPEDYLEELTAYQRLLCVTDYIAALTDRTAVDLYQKLSGIKLPS